MEKEKDQDAVRLGRKGGSVSSEAKSKAAKKNLKKRWALYRAAQRKLKKKIADRKRLV